MGKRKSSERHGLGKHGGKRIRIVNESDYPNPPRRSVRLQKVDSRRAGVKHERASLLRSPSTTNSNPQDRSSRRKRIIYEENSSDRQQERPAKERKACDPAGGLPYAGLIEPVTHWVLTAFWPQDFVQRGLTMPDAPSSKRRSSSSHRSQTLERMGTHGVFMESSNLIQKDSEELCEKYLSGTHKIVKSSVFSSKEFGRVLDRVRNLNEARIQRDITPWVVPPAETLIIRGELQNDWIGEELDAEWIRCATLGSTTPKPDYTAGLLRSSFTEEEIRKLENYASPLRPFYFTPRLCFPFLICEAKTGEKGLNEADRQNIHSASIAVKALVLLYQATFGETAPQRVLELYGRILVFTISHDNDRVFLYGHFAVADPEVEGGLKFYRHPIDLFSLSTRGGADRLKAYNFVMNVYTKFANGHRKLIKDAVAQLPALLERTGLSFAASDLSLDQPNSQEDPQGASSQGDNDFATPVEPASVSQRREMSKMREQIDKLLQQLEQQRQDAKQQIEQQKQQMEQQRQDAKQQMEQQKQHMEQQLRQQNEIISLLKGSRKS